MNERPDDCARSEPPNDAVAAAERVPYVPPKLTRIGTLADLTRGGSGASGADIGMYVS